MFAASGDCDNCGGFSISIFIFHALVEVKVDFAIVKVNLIINGTIGGTDDRLETGCAAVVYHFHQRISCTAVKIQAVGKLRKLGFEVFRKWILGIHQSQIPGNITLGLFRRLRRCGNRGGI